MKITTHLRLITFLQISDNLGAKSRLSCYNGGMKSYDASKNILLGKLSFVVLALVVLLAVGLILSYCLPRTSGNTAVVEVKGKIVATFDLSDESRVVRYNGVEVRVLNSGVQTVVEGKESDIICNKGEVLAYPAQGVTVRIQG